MTYEIDDAPERIDRDAVWQWLSTEAYWGRSRTRADRSPVVVASGRPPV